MVSKVANQTISKLGSHWRRMPPASLDFISNFSGGTPILKREKISQLLSLALKYHKKGGVSVGFIYRYLCDLKGQQSNSLQEAKRW